MNLSDESQTAVYGLNGADLLLPGQRNQEVYNQRYPVYNNERTIDQKGHIVYWENAEILKIYFKYLGNTIIIRSIS